MRTSKKVYISRASPHMFEYLSREIFENTNLFITEMLQE